MKVITCSMCEGTGESSVFLHEENHYEPCECPMCGGDGVITVEENGIRIGCTGCRHLSDPDGQACQECHFHSRKEV